MVGIRSWVSFIERSVVLLRVESKSFFEANIQKNCDGERSSLVFSKFTAFFIQTWISVFESY